MLYLYLAIWVIFLIFAPGKWYKIDLCETPKDFLCHILWKLDVPLNAVRLMKHLRQPIIKESTIRFSFKTTNEEAVKSCLSEQSRVPVKMSVKPDQVADPLAALKAAKEKAHKPYSTRHSVHSTSRVVIAEKQGRSTREFEVQWWPAMYNGSNYGKLTLRFYVSKILI